MSNPFLGEIKMFGGNFAPRGYALCDGQLLLVSQNDALFALAETGDFSKVTVEVETPPELETAPKNRRRGTEL